MDPVMTLNEAHQSNKTENKESIKPKNVWLFPSSLPASSVASLNASHSLALCHNPVKVSFRCICLHTPLCPLRPKLNENRRDLDPPSWCGALS